MEYIDNNDDCRELVEQARLGDQQSMNRLAELAEGRVFAYIYRLTLDYDLTQDLLQETLLGMVKYLKDLKNADRFWPWLFRTAWGKVQHHFRQQRHERMVQISAIEKERLLKRALQSSNDGLKDLIRRDLSEAIVEAMENMKLDQRNILILRCFERMSFSEIAGFIGCKELRARVLFFRAKNSLGWQLSRRGFGRQLLLIALGLLGLMTAPTEATAATTTVTAASLEVGFLGTVVGAAGTKLGVAIVTAITAVVLTVTVKAVLITALYILLVLICLVVADLCSR